MKRLFKTIGVALCVAPIFISAQAQQANAEARLLLEVQALREEVAQLRDMVERQAWELQRVQRGGSAASVESGANNAGTAVTPSAAAPPPTSSVDPVAPTQAAYGAEPAPVTETMPVPAAEADFYRPREAADTNREVSIRDVPINADARPQPPAGYAPVVERSVGTSGNQPLIPPPAANPASVPTSETVVLTPPSVSQGSTARAAAALPTPVSGNSGAVVRVPTQVPPADPQGVPAASTAANPVVNPAPAATTAAVAAPIAVLLPEQEYYDQGFNLVKQGDFDNAINVFKQQIANYPQGSLVGDAHYWIGESSFLARDLDTSKKYFKLFLQNFPQSGRIPGAMLRTAYIEQEQGNQIEARILLNEIIQYHPRSDAVHAARNRLAALENLGN